MDDLNKLRELVENLEQLEADVKKLEDEKKKLEALLDTKETLNNLKTESKSVEKLSQNRSFKQRLCEQAQNSQTILDIAEVVADVTIAIIGVGLPVSILGMMAIRISKITIDIFCRET